MEKQDKQNYIAKLILKLLEVRLYFENEKNIEYYSIIDEAQALIHNLGYENDKLNRNNKDLLSAIKNIQKHDSQIIDELKKQINDKQIIDENKNNVL